MSVYHRIVLCVQVVMNESTFEVVVFAVAVADSLLVEQDSLLWTILGGCCG